MSGCDHYLVFTLSCMFSSYHHSHDYLNIGSNKMKPVGAATSEMDSVPLPRWAES
jgi:hypothetical protein